MASNPPDEHVREVEHPHLVTRNARYGLVLFFIYVLLYGGFMGLSAFAPRRMGAPVIGGVNLAIVYGFGLIVAALVLAIIYMVLCRPGGAATETPEQEAETMREAREIEEREIAP